MVFMKCITDGCDSEAMVGKRGRAKVGYRRRQKVQYKKCRFHYAENVKKSIKRVPAQRYIDKNGYVQVFYEGKRIAEHRKAMIEKLGRPLEKWESVHHINGIRDDNRPDNLELWLGAIRYGQRAKDVVCPHCSRTYIEE